MSLRDRIEDSKLLFAAGQLEGALVSVLLAVAGTSRKRYPKGYIKDDRVAFGKFLRDERKKISDGKQVKIGLKNGVYRLEDLLYKFVRNNLVHEAKLDDQQFLFEYGDFLFEPGAKDSDHFTISSELVLRLANVVETARENDGIFPKDRFDRLPDPVTLKKCIVIEFQLDDDNIKATCSACSVVREVWEETGEILTWLHLNVCQELNGKLTDDQSMRIVIPAKYVLGIAPGPECQRTKRRTSCDVGFLPPKFPAPSNAMDLAEIEQKVTEMQIPMVATTIKLYRPHFEARKQREKTD
jgi:hypothetical protein